MYLTRLVKSPQRRQFSTLISPVESVVNNFVILRHLVATRPPVAADASIVCGETLRIARLFDENPDVALRVFERLSEDRRRHLLVAGSANEWYGARQAGALVDRADADGDDKISPKEYHTWIEQNVSTKQPISWRKLILVAIHAGAPFVAFGFLDNSVMILSGDVIDNAFGTRFGLTAMGAAALGGVCSGAFGVQFHGMTQRLVSYIFPFKSSLPASHPKVRLAVHLGGSVGIALGLILGMAPLLFFP